MLHINFNETLGERERERERKREREREKERERKREREKERERERKRERERERKDAACSSEAALKKTAAIWPLTPHLTNHLNKHYWRNIN